MRASTRAPFATVTSWWKIRPVTSAELSNVTLRANMRPVRRPQICTSLATTSPSKYPLEPRTRRSAQTRPKTLPWMCKSPSVSRKPSAVSASPRCDAGNSVFPGSRGVVLNARRGGAVIKKDLSVPVSSPVRIMAASAMSRKVIADAERDRDLKWN